MIISPEIARQTNEILLRHRQQILELDTVPGKCSAELIAAGLKNLECMGCTIERETIEKMSDTAQEAVIEFFERTQCAVNFLVLNDPARDARLKYEPMYPGFPRQVMQASSAELFINAIVHYITDGQWMVDHSRQSYAANAGSRFVPIKLRVLKSVSIDEFKAVCGNLMNANTSISSSDAEDIKFFFENFADAADYIPEQPAFKENAAVIARIGVESGVFSADEFVSRFSRFFENPNDVLRLAAALSQGDVSLAAACRFRSFSRKERRLLLQLLNEKSSLLENMVPKREVWLRLGEKLHPGEYPCCSRIAQAFKALRENVNIRSFKGKVELAIACGHFDEAVKLLSRRPGDFARALDHLLRKSPDQKLILDAFEAAADKVSTRVLLAVRTHFQHRSDADFSPMTEQLTPEEFLERKKSAAQNQQSQDAAEISYREAVRKLQEIEAAEAKRISDLAILQSTFDRDEIAAELQDRPLAGDALAAAVNGLAKTIVENTFIAAANKDFHSDLKTNGIETPYEKQRRLALQNLQSARVRVRRKRADQRQQAAIDAESIRVFLPKGHLTKSCIIANELTGIPAESSQRIVEICEKALRKAYEKRPSLGKVWISEQLKDYCVPFSQRSASKALRTIVRGSKLRFSEELKTVRGFVWWKNANDHSRTDIDLSALLLDKDWKYVEHFSFTNLRSSLTNCCHSGDIVNAPQGAAEYIDIDLEAAQAAGVRYAVFSIYSFTRHKFCDLPECSFGWMEREDAQAGEIFDASGVANKIDLGTPNHCGVPVFFDLQEKCAIWMDMSTVNPLWGWNCLENNAGQVLAICRGFESMHKPNLYDLAAMHTQARGELVQNKADADVIFDIEAGITPFDTDIWMAEYI